MSTGPSGHVSETCRADGRSCRQKHLLELTSVCEEVANSIEDHRTGGEDRAPRRQLRRPLFALVLCMVSILALAEVRFGAHCGLKSDIVPSPKRANSNSHR